MYEVLDKDTIIFETLPHLSVAKRGYVSKGDQTEVIQSILYKLKTGCQWQITSSFSWFCFRCLWAACPATARAGSRKRTYFSCRFPYACTRSNRFFCQVLGGKFNIQSGLFVHQSSTLSQKIDSREGCSLMNKGLEINADEMYFYLRKPSFAPF